MWRTSVRIFSRVGAADSGFAPDSSAVGAAIGSATPLALGQLQDGGMTISGAMTVSITISGLLVVAMIWLGPETRGRHFSAFDDDEPHGFRPDKEQRRP